MKVERLDAAAPSSRQGPPAAPAGAPSNNSRPHQPAGGNHRGDAAAFEIVDQRDVGAIAGRDKAAILQARRCGRRSAKRRDRRDAAAEPPADQRGGWSVVEVAFLERCRAGSGRRCRARHRPRCRHRGFGQRLEILRSPTPRGSGSPCPSAELSRAPRPRSSPRGRCGCRRRDSRSSARSLSSGGGRRYGRPERPRASR